MKWQKKIRKKKILEEKIVVVVEAGRNYKDEFFLVWKMKNQKDHILHYEYKVYICLA